MIFEGMPWPLVLPLAIIAMVWGSIQTKREFELAARKALKKERKRKRKQK
jgi:hypothetical protein